MNVKITFSDLAALLALHTGKTKKVSEEFLKEFFEQISVALEEGENVRIKGFGTFKVSRVEARKSVNVTTGQEFEIPAHNRISFVAAKELAAAVNAPFEMFEAVELAEGLEERDLERGVAEEEISSEAYGQEDVSTEIGTDTLSVDEGMDNPDPEAEMEVDEMENEIEEEETCLQSPEAAVETVMLAEEKTVPVSAPDPEETKEVVAESEYLNQSVIPGETEEVRDAEILPERSTDGERSHRKKMIWMFVAGFVAAALIAVIVSLGMAYFSLSKRLEEVMAPKIAHSEAVDILEHENSVTENETLPEAEALSQASQGDGSAPILPVAEEKKTQPETKEKVAETRPSDSFSYDRISNTRFLTTMAKHYYGNYEFWPYIYEANPNLGHPDRIKPGTRIRIPPLSSLGADPSDPADVAAAKRKGAAIYARYNTPMTPSKYKGAGTGGKK